MVYRWFNVIGLVFDLIGALFLAYGLIISKAQAIELGISRICSDDDEGNLRLPAVQDRVKQSSNAKIGVALLAIGFILQIIGNWPR